MNDYTTIATDLAEAIAYMAEFEIAIDMTYAKAYRNEEPVDYEDVDYLTDKHELATEEVQELLSDFDFVYLGIYDSIEEAA